MSYSKQDLLPKATSIDGSSCNVAQSDVSLSQDTWSHSSRDYTDAEEEGFLQDVFTVLMVMDPSLQISHVCDLHIRMSCKSQDPFRHLYRRSCVIESSKLDLIYWNLVNCTELYESIPFQIKLHAWKQLYQCSSGAFSIPNDSFVVLQSIPSGEAVAGRCTPYLFENVHEFLRGIRLNYEKHEDPRETAVRMVIHFISLCPGTP